MKCIKHFCVVGLFLYAASSTALSSSEFFTSPDLVDVKVAPGGGEAAMVRLVDEAAVIDLLNVADRSKRQLFSVGDYSSDEPQISNLVWLDDRYIAVQLSERREGIKDLLDTKSSRRLIILDTTSSESRVLSVRTKGWLAHPIPMQAGKFLYAKTGAVSKLYVLDVNLLAEDKTRLGKLDRVDGGQFKADNERRSIDGLAIRWYLNFDGEVAAVLAVSREAKLTLTRFDEDKNFILKVFEDGEESAKSKKKKRKRKSSKSSPVVEKKKFLLPIMPAYKASTFYSLNINEDFERTVYLVDYKTGKEEKIYETSAFKILDILVDRGNKLVGVQVLKNGTVVNEYLDVTADADADNMISMPVSASMNNKVFANYSESHSTPGFYSLHTEGGELNKFRLGGLYPSLPEVLNTSQVISTNHIEGVDIPYILNTPENQKDAPLVVMPHGGPIGVYDTPYYDMVTQYLVSLGYRVLRVNFRGSSGHSDELMKAGKKEWGRKILGDIHQTTLSVIERYTIKHKVCLLGFSYGGYATAELLIRYPEVYSCGVAISGVYDLNLHIHYRERSDEQQAWMYEYIGKPAEEYDYLKSVSPVFKANKLQRPILVMHGRQDEVVSVEHAHRFVGMMKKYGIPYEWYEDEELGHNFDDMKRAALMMQRASQFLAKHLQ